jgi:hypothetical protein
MALEDIKDQLRERLSELWSRVQESPAYNNVREKYETLSPGAQRGLKLGAIVLALIILVSVPLSYFSSSSSSDSEYESKRQLIRGLLRASRLANEASSLPPSLSAEDFKASLQSDIAEFNLLPEQVGPIEDLNPDALGGALAPKSIMQHGVSLALKKLNLKQVVEIGYRLQGKNLSAKLIGLDVRAGTPDPHYFDVIYQMIIYSMPAMAESEPAAEPDAKSPPTEGSDSKPPAFKPVTGGGKGSATKVAPPPPFGARPKRSATKPPLPPGAKGDGE